MICLTLVQRNHKEKIHRVNVKNILIVSVSKPEVTG